MSDSKQDENNKEYAEAYARGRSGDFVRDFAHQAGSDKNSIEYKAYEAGAQDRSSKGFKSADECGSGESSDSGSSRVICTHFYRTGQMDAQIWRADMEFTRRLSARTIRGYHFWAIPYVRLMRRSRLAELVMLPIARTRAQELAYQLGVSPRGSFLGKCVRVILEPLCWLIGGLVSEQNWEALWNQRTTA